MVRKRSVLIASGLVLGYLLSGCGSGPEGNETAHSKQQSTKAEAAADQPQAKEEPAAGKEPATSTSSFEASPARSANTPPKVTSAKIIPNLIYTDTDVKVEVESQDPDGDWVNYAYQWMKIDAGGAADSAQELEGQTEATLRHDAFARDDAIAVRVTPSDWYSKGETYQSKFMLVLNAPPRILSTPPAAASDTYTYQVQAEDADGDAIRFALAPEAPSEMTIDSDTGLLTWPMKSNNAGTYQIVVQAHDGHGGSSFQRFNLTVGVVSESDSAAARNNTDGDTDGKEKEPEREDED